jgi:hypothetical protein
MPDLRFKSRDEEPGLDDASTRVTCNLAAEEASEWSSKVCGYAWHFGTDGVERIIRDPGHLSISRLCGFYMYRTVPVPVGRRGVRE